MKVGVYSYKGKIKGLKAYLESIIEGEDKCVK
jgi:hypothetical protein